MRLTRVKIANYRRLATQAEAGSEMEQSADPPTVDLDADVLCIVGPNAAGKSSLLDAVVHLGHDRQFDQGEGTRVPNAAPLAPRVEGSFVLDGDDLKEIQKLPGGKEVRRFVAVKEPDGRSFHPRPRPETDLEPRQKVAKRLSELKESGWGEGSRDLEGSQGVQPPDQTLSLLDRALTSLQSGEEELEETEIAPLRLFRDRLAAVIAGQHGVDLDPPANKFHRLVGDLEKQAELEELGSANRQVVDALRPRMPRMLKFESEARELQAVYDLNDGATRNTAIDNLLALADSSWEELEGIVQSGDVGQKMSWTERVNARLAEEITESWGQTPLRVVLDVDGANLRLTMEMDSEDYIPIDAQSDGLRQFVALRAFIAREKTAEPIVLIDEADTHLHYDAQADLVTVFEEQDEASQIVYTTHSAGCLPRDIGVGIRGVVPIKRVEDDKLIDTDHSKIINKFWVGEKGFSPLLIAMGASAFAFSAAQKALVTEGISDAMLIPTLIRQAIGKARLDYQVVPSFAEVRPDDVEDLDLLAARVAYLADSDAGGEAHVEKLTGNGVLDEQITYLGGEGKGLSLEDLVAKEIYCNAVDAELDRWHEGLKYPREELPDEGRGKAVEEWCAKQEDDQGEPIKFSKPAIAQRVLDQRWDRDARPPKERNLVGQAGKQVLKDLDKDTRAILKQATQHLKREIESG